jgi:hypothetical protein
MSSANVGDADPRNDPSLLPKIFNDDDEMPTAPRPAPFALKTG